MKIITNLLKDTRDEWLVRTVLPTRVYYGLYHRIHNIIAFTDNQEACGKSEDNTLNTLVKTTATATINASNPIVDRIMDDDSVEGVLMTNKEGAPILTNVSVTSATNFGRALHKFGVLSQMYVKELNPLEEIMIIRIQTKKNEIMMAPDSEFNIVVIQHARARHKLKDKNGKEK